MKYENFDKAKSLVDGINKRREIIEQLQSNDVTVRLSYSGNYTIMTIGTWDSCEHSCRELANDFRLSLIKHYQAEENKMLSELETL